MAATVSLASPRIHRWPNLVAALLLIVVAAGLLGTQERVRHGEAWFAQWMVAALTEGRVASAGAIVWFGIGTDQVSGLNITALCSTVVLVVPLLVLATVILFVSRVRPGRVVAALSVSLGLVIVCNAARFASAAFAYQRFGREGFDLVHRYVGSLGVILGFVVAMLLLLVLSLRQKRDSRGVLPAGHLLRMKPDGVGLRRDRRRR